MGKIRSFLAIDVDNPLKDKIIEVQRILEEADAQLKFVEPENLHFTLKFFGQINNNMIEKLSRTIKEKIGSYKPFKLKIEGVGVFPNKNYMRVIWLGAKNPEEFSEIQKTLDEEFKRLGFKKEKSYIPHLTIARVKGGKNKDRLLEKIEELENVQIGEMQIKELKLKKSELKPEGPTYTTIKTFKL
ncbi:MAG: RNA 2',3'-cyclic phosphodiesterase [Methanothermobacter tenebrarum]|nr:RNA 2',3'-cyclic phosphodiesterase [Methanothermobacter sp.]HOQ20335.1 RNA 2',3'-cyclic phosphodiesterase [Methanothermobacter sp.]